MRKELLAIFVLFLLIACGDGNVVVAVDPVVQFEVDSIKIREYLTMQGFSDDEIGVTENGINYVILDPGTGEKIDESDFVEYNYIGKTLGDTIFDTSIKEVNDSLSLFYKENPIIIGGETVNVFTRTEFEPFFITYSSSGWSTPTGLISGWGEGIASTFNKLGTNGRALIAIPSASAYGTSGIGVFIDSNTPIAFELSIVKITKQ